MAWSFGTLVENNQNINYLIITIPQSVIRISISKHLRNVFIKKKKTLCIIYIPKQDLSFLSDFFLLLSYSVRIRKNLGFPHSLLLLKILRFVDNSSTIEIIIEILIRCWTFWIDHLCFFFFLCCSSLLGFFCLFVCFYASIEFFKFSFQMSSSLFSEHFCFSILFWFYGCNNLSFVFCFLHCSVSSSSHRLLLFGLGMVSFFVSGAFPQMSGASWLDILSRWQ